jgi:hypothetical protein
MGDSKSIDMVKDALRKIPDSDHSNLKDVKEDVKGDVKKHVGEGAPGTIQNPFGDIVRQRHDHAFQKMAWGFSRPGRRLRLTGTSQAAESAEKATNLAKERGAGTGPISG